MTKEDLQAAVEEAATRAATQALAKRDAEYDAEVARVSRQGREELHAAKREAEIARAEAETARREADAARRDAEAARRELDKTDTAKREAEMARAEAELARRDAEAAWRERDEYAERLEEARLAGGALQTDLSEARAEIEQHQKLAKAESAARRHVEQQLSQQEKIGDQQAKHIDSQRAAEERGRQLAERQLNLATRQISALEALLKQRDVNAAGPSRNAASASSTRAAPERGTADRAAAERTERSSSHQRTTPKPLPSTTSTPQASLPSSKSTPHYATPLPTATSTPQRTAFSTPPRAATPPPPSTYVYVPPGSARVTLSDNAKRIDGVADSGVPRLNLGAISEGRFEKTGGHASPRRSSPMSTPRGEAKSDAPAASQYGYTGQLPSPLPAYAAAALSATALRTPNVKRTDTTPKVQPSRSLFVRVDAGGRGVATPTAGSDSPLALRSASRGISPPKQPQRPASRQSEGPEASF